MARISNVARQKTHMRGVQTVRNGKNRRKNTGQFDHNKGSLNSVSEEVEVQ